MVWIISSIFNRLIDLLLINHKLLVLLNRVYFNNVSMKKKNKMTEKKRLLPMEIKATKTQQEKCDSAKLLYTIASKLKVYSYTCWVNTREKTIWYRYVHVHLDVQNGMIIHLLLCTFISAISFIWWAPCDIFYWFVLNFQVWRWFLYRHNDSTRGWTIKF